MKKLLIFAFVLAMCMGLNACKFLHICNYADATCEEPEKCSCGAIRNDPLGHTTKLGVCSRCEEFNNDYESAVNNISKNAINSMNTFVEAVELLYYRSPISKSDINEFAVEINKSKDYLNRAISYCGSIVELSTIKNYLTSMKKSLDGISGNTAEAYWSSFQRQYKIYTEYGKKVNNLLIEWNVSTFSNAF